MVSNRKRTKCSAAFARDVTVAVVLNLDAKSPNANTISLFRNGVRIAQPQPLPDELKGKTLFPTVSFQRATVHTNFAAAVVPLPFTCKAIGEATQKDSVITKYPEPEGGKYTVLFPVSLPDEGSFDWLDSFLEKNPDYTELSDRAFANWATKSGVAVPGKKSSNDRQETNLQDMAGIKKLLMEVAAMQPRNFVIMEVKGNLTKEERAAALAKFKGSVFKTVAEVIVSEPPSSFKRIVQAKTLKKKQDEADREHKKAMAQEKHQWQVRKRTKDMEKAQKKRAKEAKKKAEEAKRTREVAMKKAQKELAAKKAKAAGKEPEEEKEEEEPVPIEESDEEPEEAEEEEPVETDPPKASLTAEEKALRFFVNDTPDLTLPVLARSFAKFSLPEDGEFDLVKHTWAKEKEAAAYVKNWVLEKKHTTRVEDIVPSAGFKQQNQKWQSVLGQWKGSADAYKRMKAAKAAAKSAKAAKKIMAEKKAKAEAEKKAKADAEGKKDDDKAAVKKVEVKAPAVVEEESEEEEEEVAIDFDGIDVFGVEDILDVGGKLPIFRDFQADDYTMLSLRFELHLLAHSFSKDCSDPDRTGIHLDHLAFYYQKYYGKPLNFKAFGAEKPEDLVELVNDTITVEKSIISSLVPADLESHAVFAKLTESARRHRSILVDMGDESAKLKLNRQGGGGGGGDGDQQHGGQKRSWSDDGGNQGGGKGGWGGNKGGGAWGGNKWPKKW
jgi:hypothetical protein